MLKKGCINANINKKNKGFLLTEIICGILILTSTMYLMATVLVYSEKLLQKNIFLYKEYVKAREIVEKIAYQDFFDEDLTLQNSSHVLVQQDLPKQAVMQSVTLDMVDQTCMTVEIVYMLIEHIPSLLIMVPKESFT